MNVQMTPPPGQTQARSTGLANRLSQARALPRKYLIGGAALVVALGGFWLATHDGGGPPQRRITAAPVRVAAVEQRDMQVIERTIGTVVANASVAVTARVQGQLMKAHFKEGDIVKAGELLFEIDPRPYQAALAQALAQQARDQAQLENANNDARRYADLFRQNAISVQQRDVSAASAKALAATVEADKAQVAMARLNLEYSRIRAPVTGKTGPILIQPGNLVTPSSSVGASSLVTINEIQPVKISLSLPQSDLPRIQETARSKGLRVTINLRDGGGGENISAPVDFIGNAVNNTTGTIELRATYPNPDSALIPGQLVDVVVGLSEIPDALVVPREAINTGPAGQFVYAVRESTAQQVPVKVLFDDTVNAAVQGAVKRGETVIVDGQLRVIPGAKVNVLPATKQQSSTDTRTSGRRNRAIKG